MRILWLKTELLHPVDKGGKIRTYNMLKELKRDHEITYLTLDEQSDPEAKLLAKEYCETLITVPHKTRPKFSVPFYAELAANLVSSLPYFMKKYESIPMRLAIAELLARNSFDVLVCDFLQPAINLPRPLSVPSVLFQHNVEATIWRRHYEVQQNPIKRVYLYNQWRKAQRYEADTCRQFDFVVAVSPQDSEIICKEYGVQHVDQVATGVDTEYFKPNGDVNPQPRSLVFTGSMDWLPNEDAMQYFIKQILPLIREAVPDITLTIVGRNPYPSLVELSQDDPKLIVTGRVHDVRPYIEQAAAYIVPIRVGGGTRLKIYEAMAMGKPVISTSVGAEGLPLNDGVELLLADTPKEFAEAVIRVVTDSVLADRLATRAAQMVRDRFGWRNVADEFAQLCERARTNYDVKT